MDVEPSHLEHVLDGLAELVIVFGLDGSLARLESVPVIVLWTATLFPEAMTSSTSMCMSGVCDRIMLNISIGS